MLREKLKSMQESLRKLFILFFSNYFGVFQMAEKTYAIDSPVNIQSGNVLTPNQVYNQLLIQLATSDMKSKGYELKEQPADTDSSKKYSLFKNGKIAGTIEVELNRFTHNATSLTIKTGDKTFQDLMSAYKIATPQTDLERARADQLRKLSNL